MERASGSKKNSVRILSFLLAAIMVIGIFPISVFADEELETALEDAELLVEEEPEVIAEPEEELAEETEPEIPEAPEEVEETEEEPEVTEEAEQEPAEETEPEIPEEVEVPEETEEVFEEVLEEPETVEETELKISEMIIDKNEAIGVGTFEDYPLVVDLAIVGPNENYKTGDKIKFKLDITKNPGVASLYFTVKYDPDAFGLVNTPQITSTFSKNAGQLKEERAYLGAVNTGTDGEIIFNWIYSGALNTSLNESGNCTTTGIFAEFTLEVKPEAAGTYSVSVEPDPNNVFNAKEVEVSVDEIEDEEVAIVKTITFNANDGPYTPVSVAKTYSENVTLPDLNDNIARLKKGCSLIGWDENKYAEEATYAPGSEFTAEKDTTLYAIWEMAEYTITYDYVDGIEEDINKYPQSYTIEDTIKFGTAALPNPTKNGYSFAGWYSDPTLSKKVTQIAKGSVGDITLYASWKLLSFTIKYNLNGGKELTEETTPEGDHFEYTKNPTKYSAADDNIELNTNIVKTGYEFDGWYEDKACEGECVETIESNSAKNYTLYAKFVPNEYTIKFDGNGADNPDAMAPQNVDDTVAESLDQNKFVKTGYKFAGWTATVAGKEKSFSDKAKVSKLTINAEKELTLTAKWTLLSYTIKYNLNGGKEVVDPETKIKNPTKFSVEDLEGGAIVLNPCEKAGYKFTGWYDNKNFVEPAITKINAVKEDGTGYTLYAGFEPNKYTIKFDGNGETSGTMEDMKNVDDTKSTQLNANAFIKKDCKFAGWTVTVGGKEKKISDKAKVSKLTTGEETLTLTAKWTPGTTYTIKYTLNGGKEIVDPVTKIKNPTKFSILDVEDDKKIVLNECQKAGYKFIGWYDNKELTGTAITEINAVKEGGYTLFAKFVPNEYTIKFDGNGADNPDAMAPQDVDDTESRTLTPNEFVKTGYKFAGWTATVAGKEKSFSDKAKVSKLTTTGENEITFTAKWTMLSYTIKYTLNGGKEVPEKDPITNKDIKNPTKFNIEDLKNGAIVLNPCQKAGYKFIGWYDNKDLDGTPITKITTVKEDGTGYTLYAGFEPNKYTIVFDGNGATSGAMADMENVDDTKSTELPANTFKKEGCKFAGWTTIVGGKEKSISDKAKVSKLTMGEDELILTAKWTSLKTYTIKYNLTGGKEAPRKDPITNKDIKNPTKIGMADGDIILNEAVKEGFNFAGWYNLNTNESLWDEEAQGYVIKCDIKENITVYAKWEFKAHK